MPEPTAPADLNSPVSLGSTAIFSQITSSSNAGDYRVTETGEVRVYENGDVVLLD